jgi:hypothetical protein
MLAMHYQFLYRSGAHFGRDRESSDRTLAARRTAQFVGCLQTRDAGHRRDIGGAGDADTKRLFSHSQLYFAGYGSHHRLLAFGFTASTSDSPDGC